MKPFVVRQVLAPTDLSDSSVPALRFARLFAEHFAAKLTVVHAEPIVYPVDYLGTEGVYVTADPEQKERLRGEVEKHAAPAMGGRPYDIEVAVGQPISAILSIAREREADLIVMGTHLRHGWRRALLGSVSEGVMHGARCPVLTVASHDGFVGRPLYAITDIVCPINFSDVAHESVVVAAKIAEAFNARLTIVHVLEGGDVTSVPADEEQVRLWVGPDLENVCSSRILVIRGGAAERVLDCADDIGADFLVVGAQHKRFRDATVLGTTTERLIRFAPCPVMVVPRDVSYRAVHEDELVAAAR